MIDKCSRKRKTERTSVPISMGNLDVKDKCSTSVQDGIGNVRAHGAHNDRGPKRLPRATETTTLGTRGGSHVLSNRLSNYATHRLNDGRLENEMLGE